MNTIPLEAWTLDDKSRARIRKKELRLIKAFLKGKPRCDYYFEVAQFTNIHIVPGRCRMIGDHEFEGEHFCHYHLPFVAIPNYPKKHQEMARLKAKHLVDNFYGYDYNRAIVERSGDKII